MVSLQPVSGSGGPPASAANTRVKTDANNNLLVAVVSSGYGRATGQVAANASVATATVPTASDASYRISANVLVTASTTHAFNVECAYTDEGNTARVLVLTFELVGASAVSSIANANGAVPYHGLLHHIRAKAGTTITIRSAAGGTYTTVTYNIEGAIDPISLT